MRSILLILAGLATLAFAGCGDDGAGSNGDISVQTLVSDLEYPKSLWPKGDKVFFTETAGRNTVYGGRVSLCAYDIPGGVMAVIKNDPANAEAVVAASSSLIYLTAWEGAIPGETGNMSWVNPLSGVETHLLDIEIAATDMYIDAGDNILIVGSSDKPDAKSMLLMLAGDYTNPIILKVGLGRVACVTKSGDDIYYSGADGTYRIAPGGGTESFVNRAFASISCSFVSLYYADPAGGSVGAVNLSRKTDRKLVLGLKTPIAVRWLADTKRLYVLEAGTDANEYKDGALKVVYGIE